MQLFLDTANVDDIKEIAVWGILSGVTTNPSLIAKEGRDFREVISEICDIVDGPISAEVISTDREGMIREAREKTDRHNLREADLSRHLANGDKKHKDEKKENKNGKADEESEEEELLAVTDYALHEALITLKAYSVFQAQAN